MEFNKIEGTTATSKTWSGFWSGTIWSFIGFILIYLVQIIVVICLGAIEAIETGEQLSRARIDQLFSDGDAVAISFVILLPLIIAMLAFVIKARRKKPFFDYLAFKKVKLKTLMFWLAAALALLFIDEYINILIERPVPEWVVTAYQTSNNYILLFLGMAVLGPVTEELLFRGYIFRAWAESRLGPYPAIVLISLLWAGLHLQYDLYEMFTIFTLGLLLCWSRFKSGSLYPSILIHIFWNLISLIQVGRFVYT